MGKELTSKHTLGSITGYVKKYWCYALSLREEMIGELCLQTAKNPNTNYFFVCNNLYQREKRNQQKRTTNNQNLFGRFRRNCYFESLPHNIDKRLDLEERMGDLTPEVIFVMSLLEKGYTNMEIGVEMGINQRDLHSLKKEVVNVLDTNKELPSTHNKSPYIVVTSEGEKTCPSAKAVWSVLRDFPNSEVYSNTGKCVKVWEKK